MREQDAQSLSALVDGEASELELRSLLKKVDEDPDIAEKWRRYQLASSILKQQTRPCRADYLAKVDLSARVAAAIAEEAAPTAQPAVAPAARSRWFDRVSNAAIAASVAAVVMVAWEFTRPAAVSQGPAMAASSPAAVGAGVMPVQYTPAPRTVQQVRVINQQDRAQTAVTADERFNQYLISHSGNAVLTAKGGPVPYARVVALKPGQQHH